MSSKEPQLSDPVPLVWAWTVDCPKCGAKGKEEYCRYLVVKKSPVWNARYTGVPARTVVHAPGDLMMSRVHTERLREFARVRQERWYREQRRVMPASFRARHTRHPARDALQEFDRREYEAMRDWLRANAWIFWTEARPDGTPRGEPYA